MSGIQLKHYLFKPTLIPSLITLILLCLMIWLGFWQLDRATFKDNIQTQLKSNQDKPEIAIYDIEENEKDWLYRPAFITGRFDTDHQIYLDNQVHNMVSGYSVLTPVWLTDQKAILVNRGWLPLGKSRSTLPDISIDTRIRRIHGFAANAPSKGIVLSDNANIYEPWPPVLQYIDIAEIEKEIGYKLMPMILVMNREKETPLTPLPIKINMPSEKHTAYAFQWFGLSLALLTIFIVVNTKNTEKE